jgi:xanthine dehydrogenase accessory factor
MREILDDIEGWLAAGQGVAVATVLGVRRSAPRPPGAKMALSADGQVVGAVSGGCVEGAVVEAAERTLASGEPQRVQFGIADDEAFDLGLPCGGEIDVWIERLPALPAQERFAAALRSGGRGVLVTRLDDGAKLWIDADGEQVGSFGDVALDLVAERMWSGSSGLVTVGERELFADVVAPPPRLIVFGAIDFSAALCRAARLLGWTPFVIDPRARWAADARFPDAERVLARWPHDAIRELGALDPATYVVVLAHDPKIDDAALELALPSAAAYVGAMGSRRASDARAARLRERGVSDEALARLASPIGLDIGARSGAETAVSILAEIIAATNGRDGVRLRDANGSIHARPS